MDDPLAIQQANQHVFDFQFAHAGFFFLPRWGWSVPFLTLALRFQVWLKNLRLVAGNWHVPENELFSIGLKKPRHFYFVSSFRSCEGFWEPFSCRFSSFPIHWSKSDERFCESNSTLLRSFRPSTDDQNSISSWSWRPPATRFIFNWILAFWEFLKPPENLCPW